MATRSNPCPAVLLLGLWSLTATAQETSVAQVLPEPVAPRAEVVVSEPPTAPDPAGVALPNPDAGRDGKPTDPALPVQVRIIAPRPREIIPTGTVDVFIQVDNYQLAEEGNRLHVFVDNDAPVPWHDLTRPFPLKNLNQGGHTIRILAVRPDGTSLRQSGAFAMVHFYVKKKDFQNYTDPALPFLTVNQPSDGPAALDANDRLCFDYWIHNVDFAANPGIKLRYKLDTYEGTLAEQGPVLWANLQPGRHQLVVELFDSSGQPMFGPFNRVERKFEVRQVLRAVPVPDENSPAPASGIPLP